MSLFQCEVCGCMDNTALSSVCTSQLPEVFDWSGVEDRMGKELCSACAPKYHADGKKSGLGAWHGEFDRVYLPMDQFFTNKCGDLEHRNSGSTHIRKFAIKIEKY